MKTIRTKIELARRLKITRPTLDRYLSLEGAPRRTKSGWNFEAVLAFLNHTAEGEATLSLRSDDIKGLRARELALKCEKLRQQIDIEGGRYLDAGEVCRTVFAIGDAQKRILRQKLEEEAPPRLEGLRAAEIKIRMCTIVDEVCRIFSEGAETYRTPNQAALTPGT
jgi:hypothetical protein